MKTIFKTIMLVALTVGVISCKDNKGQNETTQSLETADAAFVDEASKDVWEGYLAIKDALVKSDETAVQSASTALARALSDEQSQLKALAEKMATTTELEKQRALFSDLGRMTEDFFKEALSEGTIYKQYCPMAFNNEGGYWFSNTAAIRNPYFGDKMLKCGTIDQKIEK